MDAIRGYTTLTLLLASLAISGSCGGDRITRPRVFLNEQASVNHFRQHQAAFQKLAIDWLASGTDSFCTFGPNAMLWHSNSLIKSGHTWSMRVLGKDGWTDRSFQSLDEAAATIGATGKDLSNLQFQMLALSVECIKTVPIMYHRKSGRYVECALPPATRGYGFRFAPAEDSVSSQALTRWASIPPPRSVLDMRAVDSGWFYYEGLAYTHAPFSGISGKVIYANGEPAKKIDVSFIPAFGYGGGYTDTDESGKFHATWLPSGRYRIVANVQDTSIRSDRAWYYPGVLDSDTASDVLVGEGESVDIGTFTVPIDPPRVDRRAESIAR
jgi:hypothetical protein